MDTLPDRWITVEHAAALLGVSAITVRRRITDGTIVARRFGPKFLRVDADQLEQAGKPAGRA